MTVRLHANNFSTTLNGNITNVATTMTLTSGTGLPTLAAGQFFNLTLTTGTTVEIVKVTAFAGTSITTMARAQEGTSAAAWSTGAVVALRETADSLDRKPDTPVSPVAYAVALWGTTAAGQMQSTSTSGTTGQVLQSAGTSAIPLFANPVEVVVVQATNVTAAPNTVYINTNAGLNTITLPVAPAIGTFVEMRGTTGGFWRLGAGAAQTIKYLATTTTSGGSLTCTSQYDVMRVTYITTSTWSVSFASIGSAITVA
jgi:hypothetical protein